MGRTSSGLVNKDGQRICTRGDRRGRNCHSVLALFSGFHPALSHLHSLVPSYSLGYEALLAVLQVVWEVKYEAT